MALKLFNPESIRQKFTAGLILIIAGIMMMN